MKKHLFICLSLLLSFISLEVKAQFAPLPPFSISIEKIVTPQPLPGFHSFAFAEKSGKWLIVGGRTNGLHGLNPNDGFDQAYANNNIIVVDTSTWQMFSSSLNVLPYDVADPLRSTNMQYVQDGNYLYMVGGYGRDSIQNKFVTFKTLTSIRIDSLIVSVINGTPIAPYIRNYTHADLRVCGGEMHKLGSDYYLVFGHNFSGRYDHQPGSGFYTQKYTNQIRKFNIVNTGGSVSAANWVYREDTINFHRRDLNVCPIIKPGGQEGLMAYGGVFKPDKDFPYLEPIEIGVNSDSIHSYQQTMHHYNCAYIPVYDSVTQSMHTTFLGGMSMGDYDPNTNTVVNDTNVPFISDVTTFTTKANGTMEECILPIQLPYLLGSNAKFILRKDVPHYGNDVINLRGITQRTLIGYMFGGIRSEAPNFSVSSVANDTIYRIYLDPAPFSSVKENQLMSEIKVFPNPANDLVHIRLTALAKTKMNIKLINGSGKIQKEILNSEIGAGTHELKVSTAELANGMYYLKLTTGSGVQTFPLSVAH